jgi:hypothetical protein
LNVVQWLDLRTSNTRLAELRGTQFQRTLVVNPGSVGQPKHGDPRAAYAVWTDGVVSLHRTAYDVEQTIRAFAGLTLEPQVVRSLSEVLRTGGNPPRWRKNPFALNFSATTKDETDNRNI